MGTGRSGLTKHNGNSKSVLPGVKDISDKINHADFKVFRDTASDTHEYHGDGSDVVDFFKHQSNFDEIINSMTPDERSQFESWAWGRFMGSNKAEYRDLSTSEQHMLKTYDKILDKSSLNEGIVVRRLASFSLINNGSRSTPSADALAKMEGNLVNVSMPLSASAAAQGLSIGASGKNVEYVIHIPAGTKGAGMWIGDKRINGWGPKQREFMVNRDVVFRQGKTVYNHNRGIYEVELVYVGRVKHKYK